MNEKNLYDEEMAKLRKLMDDADLDMMFDGGYPLRLILRFRFVRNFPWKTVADYTGQYETAKSVSQKVYDFFGCGE